MIDGYEIFHFVSVGLLFMTLIASFILAILAVIRLRIQRDPARRVFSWVKAAWLIFLISVVLVFTQVAMATITTRWYELSRYSGRNVLETLVARITSIADVVTRFFNVFVGIAIFLTMVTLKRCIDIAHLGTPRKVHKWPRRVAYVAATLMALLAIVSFSILLYLTTSGILDPEAKYINWSYRHVGLFRIPPGADIAAHSIQIVAALTICVQSVIAKRRCRFVASLRKPTTYFVVCAFMWLIASVFDLYFDFFSSQVRQYFSASIDVVSTFNELLRVLFGTWPIFIILVLLYVLGTHKHHSLRSIQQPPLMQEVESQTTSPGVEPRATPEVISQPVAAECDNDPTAVQSATPMTENAPTEVSATTSPHNPFPWDGLADAPPQYTPAEAPRPTLPRTDEPLVSQSTQQNPALTQYPLNRVHAEQNTLNSLSSPTARSQPNVAALSQSQGSHVALAAESNLAAQPPQHIIDQQVPEILAEPPPHDEAMGLYHQADGITPRDEALPDDKK